MSEGQHIPYQACALPVPGARSVLVVAPHPDDEVFGCGGCASLYALSGIPAQALILTDGGLWGVPPPGMDVVQARRTEAQRAAAVLGYRAPIFGPYADRSLEPDAALVKFIADHVRACRADVVLAPSPWELHPDHRAAAEATIQAALEFGDGITLVQYEVGAPLLPNALVDITPVLERKQRAMACFESQLAMQRYDRHVNALNAFRTYTLPESVLAAEGLRVATPQQALEDPFGLMHQGHPHPVSRFTPRRQTPA
jgi:LmbE family N-acetylglucosaminyl deacetylase